MKFMCATYTTANIPPLHISMSVKLIINDAVFLAKGFSINNDKAQLNLDYVYQFLTEQAYWAKNLSFEKFKTAVENSACFGVYHQDKQIGFARVVSDNSTFAYLADVFIEKEYRKQSLAKWLLQTILNQPEYHNMKRWMLATADAHVLYKQFGFKPLNKPERFMEIFNPYQSLS